MNFVTKFLNYLQFFMESFRSDDPYIRQKINWMLGFIVLMSLVLLVKTFIEWWINRPSIMNKKKLSLKEIKNSAIKQQIETVLTDKAAAKKRYESNKICLQAGFDITYGELQLICLLFAILLPILTIIFLNNWSLALLMFPLGYMMPRQIVHTIRNQRLASLEKQVDSFLELFTERYKATTNVARSLEDCLGDFEGQQPIYYEIQKTILDLRYHTTPVEAMKQFSYRTGNHLLDRTVNYLDIAESIGTDEVRERLLEKARVQSRKYKTKKNILRQQIQGPKNQCYVLIFAVPGIMLYQVGTYEGYIDFMLNDIIGQVTLTVVFAILLFSIWFTNKKIGAPIE